MLNGVSKFTIRLLPFFVIFIVTSIFFWVFDFPLGRDDFDFLSPRYPLTLLPSHPWNPDRVLPLVIFNTYLPIFFKVWRFISHHLLGGALDLGFFSLVRIALAFLSSFTFTGIIYFLHLLLSKRTSPYLVALLFFVLFFSIFRRGFYLDDIYIQHGPLDLLAFYYIPFVFNLSLFTLLYLFFVEKKDTFAFLPSRSRFLYFLFIVLLQLFFYLCIFSGPSSSILSFFSLFYFGFSTLYLHRKKPIREILSPIPLWIKSLFFTAPFLLMGYALTIVSGQRYNFSENLPFPSPREFLRFCFDVLGNLFTISTLLILGIFILLFYGSKIKRKFSNQSPLFDKMIWLLGLTFVFFVAETFLFYGTRMLGLFGGERFIHLLLPFNFFLIAFCTSTLLNLRFVGYKLSFYCCVAFLLILAVISFRTEFSDFSSQYSRLAQQTNEEALKTLKRYDRLKEPHLVVFWLPKAEGPWGFPINDGIPIRSVLSNDTCVALDVSINASVFQRYGEIKRDYPMRFTTNKEAVEARLKVLEAAETDPRLAKSLVDPCGHLPIAKKNPPFQ